MWMCPPVKMLPAIARELQRRKNCEGVLVVPKWPTSNFYGMFFNKEGKAIWPFTEEEVFRPYIYQNQGGKGPLNGKIDFDLSLLYFNKF